LDPSALEARKRALRAAARALPGADREPLARRCLANLLGLPELAGPRAVALYAAIADEVPAERAYAELRERGCRVVFPRVEGAALALCECAVGDLVRGVSGLREPPPGARIVEVRELDALVVPGLLFARDGTRLGRGAGHYDRLLAAARPDATRIGICYADRVRDALPSTAHDVPVQILVLDRCVIRCPAPADGEMPG
jgi:5-formyltetrahydrofolate cyclo-ligase